MTQINEKYPKLFQLVYDDHRALNMDCTGHPFDHTLQVAHIAALIAEDEETAHLGGAAGLCHNADRLLQRKTNASKANLEDHVRANMIPKEETVALVTKWLVGSGEFNPHEMVRITNAVLLHSALNIADCDPVLVAVQDADRICCSMADTLMATAQFWSMLPIIDPQWITADPDNKNFNNYRTPRSVAHNLECRHDWINPQSKCCVRLPKAKKLMERRVAFIDAYIVEIQSQREEIGLYPNYPAEANA